MQQFLHDLLIFVWGAYVRHPHWQNTRLRYRAPIKIEHRCRAIAVIFQLPNLSCLLPYDLESDYYQAMEAD